MLDVLSWKEVFSPPRFTEAVGKVGLMGRSYDITTGCDLSQPASRKQVEDDLDRLQPDLLVLCPPCTDESGWFHLNSLKWDKWEYLRRKALSRSFIRWCCKLFHKQAKAGRQAMFEHPLPAETWTYPEVQRLCRMHHTVKLHMCRFNLRLPRSDKLIRKGTRLIVTHESMKELAKQCPGSSDPKHECHDTIQGSRPGIGNVSSFCARYTPEFVHAVLNTVPSYQLVSHECHCVEVLEAGQLSCSDSEVLAAAETERQASDADVLQVLMRLHKNLGHPPNHDLVRILKNSQASERSIRLARDLSCSLCKSMSQPRVALPAQSQRITEFNQQIGIDVKLLQGWCTNQKVKALNIVDTASGFQRMVPFFETETSSLLRRLLEDHWIAWAGPPSEIILDPAQTNLGDPMVSPAEMQGTHVRPIAADAHWQLGKTESHGGWFSRVLDKIIEEHQPQSKAEWLECITHAHVKNQMLQVHGYSPQQYVFGKNIQVPTDLLNEPLHIVPATASLTSDAIARAQALRTTARLALIRMQDDRALRVSLLARPRRVIDFQPGDLVAYWRSQKWVKGQLNQNARWYGGAIVLGKVGRNLILLHRRQLLRVAPEQTRPATTEERQVASCPRAELLGIKELIEKNKIPGNQYVDLTSQSYPSEETIPQESEVAQQMQDDSASRAPVTVGPVPPEPEPPSLGPDAVASPPAAAEAPVPDASLPEASSSSYGPIRRRVSGKDGPFSLWRPSQTSQDDVVEIMKEVVPQLLDTVIQDEGSSGGVKRSPSVASLPTADEPATQRARNAATEALSVQECCDLWTAFAEQSTECLISEYMKKKMSKELPHSHNDPEVQEMVDHGKRIEWETLLAKDCAVRVHHGKRAQQIKKDYPDRFIGSRFVLTRKPIDEGQPIDPHDPSTFTVKGRWCLQGHLDPDLTVKAESGMLKSPTLSQLGRMTLMQVIACFQWELQLGDIKGAFLEAGPLDAKFRPLYARQPPGGIPGVPADSVIEVLGNVYGQNDAPAAWFKEFNNVAQDIGWVQSKLDPCLYTLRDKDDQSLVGIMGVHVDDTALGGSGAQFQQAVERLRSRFPYRKWRVKEGEFCGAWYKQQHDGSIHMNMASFAEKIRSINIPKNSKPDDHLTPDQIRVLRAVNGSLNWLASQSRPDLSVQTSLSQQSFPNPTIKDFRNANEAIRRAKIESSLAIVFPSIAVDKLTAVCHSDAAWANVGHHTQAGFVIGFTSRDLQHGHEVPWCPAAWRSFKLPRAVSSTLGAESQSMSLATGTAEWLLLMLSEIIDGPLQIGHCREVLSKRRPLVVTDCKSLYDHLISPSSPTSIEDKRTSIDVVIIRESCRSMQAYVRWVPTNRMIADALTKNEGDPMDLLRSCMRRARYQISPEETVLQHKAEERSRRVNRNAPSKKTTNN